MGVDIQVWQIRIGTFIQPRKCRKDVDKLFLSRKSLFLAVRICLVLSLIMLCGDVESNPGPPKSTRQNERVTTRQSTLEAFSSDRRASIEQSRFPFSELTESVHERPQSELFSFFSQMTSDLSAQIRV